MRNYLHLERYLNELLDDIYPQPSDPGHQELMEEVIREWLPKLQGVQSILDIGCGQGQAIPILGRYAPTTGVTLGSDVELCQIQNLEVIGVDFSFLPFDDDEFTLIFARHVLEHSPMPLLTLMEWHRVAGQWLILIVPSPAHYGPGGRNHYYVLPAPHWQVLLERSGWRIIWRDSHEATEYRWLCEKVPRNNVGKDQES